jgi:hypothetical protein
MQNIVTRIIIKPIQSRYVLLAQSLNVLIATRGSIRTMEKSISRQYEHISIVPFKFVVAVEMLKEKHIVILSYLVPIKYSWIWLKTCVTRHIRLQYAAKKSETVIILFILSDMLSTIWVTSVTKCKDEYDEAEQP